MITARPRQLKYATLNILSPLYQPAGDNERGIAQHEPGHGDDQRHQPQELKPNLSV